MRIRSIIQIVITALMVMLITGCYDPDDYVITPENIDKILMLSASANSIPADGFSRVDVVATISPNSDKRDIIFTTSEGTLFGTGRSEDAGKKMTVTADVSGQAVVQLQSSTDVVTAQVKATVIGVGGKEISRQIAVEFVPANSSDI